DQMEDKPRIYQRQRREVWDHLSEDEVREAIAHYWGYCTMIDEMFGEVLAALDRTGQADDTLVLFLSDHGDYAGAHGLFCKGVAAFDEAYHIPLVVRWPARAAPREVDAFVTLADILPTLVEAAGGRLPPDLSGRSLLPWLEGETPTGWPDAFFSQFNGVELYYTQRIVQTARYKYVFNGFDFDELYDLAADPYECTNLIDQLADDPQLGAVRRELVRRMWQFARREEDTAHSAYVTVALAPYGPMEAWSAPPAPSEAEVPPAPPAAPGA
ncbi:MAG TPA: sulfatase/phosphatase domain-containing protein, partial [Limnochordia bacterium]